MLGPRLLAVLGLTAQCHAASLNVMMNGLPGAMGVEIAQACMRREGVSLVPYALTGPGCGGTVDVDGVTVKLYEPADRDELAERVKTDYGSAPAGSFVCVDFTHPSAVNGNAEWYAANALPFVMGTTGGDRDALLACVEDTPAAYAVIAPNMAKQIVALQAMLEQMASEFPGSFDGYSLSVVESHQSTKADTSGTAKAVSASLATLTNEGPAFVEPFDSIERVRDTAEQLAGGGTSHRGVSPVPEGGLKGHAFHTYSLLSGDGNVEFQIRAPAPAQPPDACAMSMRRASRRRTLRTLTVPVLVPRVPRLCRAGHNVVGRSVYAEGTVDAAVFLAGQVAAAAPKRLYDMVDVLKSGSM